MSEPVLHVRKDGYQEWLLPNGLPHREDGPAVIDTNGTQHWYQNGRRHRLDGPAVITTDGSQGWYIDDQLHRTDGPAIIYADGDQAWYIENRHLTQQEFELYRFRKWAVEGELV